MDRWSPRLAMAGVVLVCLVHGWLGFRYFGSWATLTNPQPVLYSDHTYHYYYCLATKPILSRHLSTWYYDPHFMAGYPKCVIFPSSTNLYEVLAWLLAGLPPAVVCKGITLATILGWPVLAAVGAWGLGARGAALFWTALAAAAYFWSGFPQRMVYWGMVSMTLAGAMYPLCLIALARVAQGITPGRWLAAAGLCAVASFIHPAVPVALSVPYVVGWLWLMRRRARWPSQGTYGLIALAAFLANAFWIVPGWRLIGEVGTTEVGYFTGIPLGSLALSNVDVNFLCLVLGLAGLLVVESGASRAVLAAGIGLNGLIAFGAPWIDLFQVLQPGRFGLFFFALLGPSAGLGLVAAWRATQAVGPVVWRRAAQVVLLGLLAKAIIGPAYHQGRLIADMKPFQTELAAPNAALIDWLAGHVDGQGRVLFEDRGNMPGADPMANQHITPLLPTRVRAEIIGGPYFLAHVRQRFAQFVDGRLGMQPIDTMPLDRFLEYARLYNLTWMVAWSEPARQFAARHPELVRPAAVIGPYHVYRLQRAPSFLYVGTGQVQAEPDRIRITGLRPSQGHAILCYHWIPTLRCRPEGRLEPVFLADDPSPFIRLIDPPAEVEVYNAR